MRTMRIWVGVALVALALCGCKKNPSTEATADWSGLFSSKPHGRYAGVGIYSPGTAWAKMISAARSKDAPTAQLVDDGAVIVMVDSATGEVRGCGDMTGYCVGMNPWKAPLATGQIAPVSLSDHVKSTDAESSAPAASAAPAERG